MIFDYNLTYQVLVEKFYILPCLGRHYNYNSKLIYNCGAIE